MEDRNKKIIQKFMVFYLKPAFGSRSKSEIDLKVFELLKEYGYIDSDYYKVARILKITPAKAKNLLLNTELRSTKERKGIEDDIANLFEQLKKCHLKTYCTTTKILTIHIPSFLQRETLKCILREKNKAWDTSFNSELVKINIDDFIEIIPEDKRKTIVCEKSKQDFKALLIEILSKPSMAGAIGTVLKKILK